MSRVPRHMFLLALCALVVAASSFAAEATPADDDPLQFRRIYVLADRVADWPVGDTRYVPIDRDEFVKLLDVVQNLRSGAPAKDQISEAQYEARLIEDDLLAGTARLHVKHESDAPSLLSLKQCNFAVDRLRWRSGRADRPALGFDSEQTPRLLATQSDELNFDWSLRGERSDAAVLQFNLQLPACAVNELTLDLPAKHTPLVDHGLVVSLPSTEAGWRRWRIHLGGRQELKLRLAGDDGANANQQLTLARQSTTYEFSPRGLDVSIEVQLDVHYEPIRRLVVDLDPELRLVAAKYGTSDVRWSTTPGEPAGRSRIVLEFPEPLIGAGRVVRLAALAPLGPAKLARLPSFRIRNVFWQEGLARLLVPAPLVLEQISLQGCRQSKTSPLPAPLSGEAYDLQYYTPEASIDVLVARPREQLKVSTGTLVEIGGAEVKGRTIADLDSDQTEQFRVYAEVGPQWRIDSVESSTPDAVADWSVRPTGTHAQRLVVVLAKAISSKRSLRLTIEGHRAGGLNETFDLPALTMVGFPTSESNVHLMAVRATDPYDLQIRGGEELTRFDALRLTPDELSLFAEPPRGLLFSLDAKAARLAVSLVNRRPSYTGEIHVDAAVQGQVLTETHKLRCVSGSAPIERVVVHCSQKREAPIRWTLAGGATGQLSSRRLAEGEQASLGVGTGGETWEIVLRLARSEPFELRGTRSTILSGPSPIALAALPEASAQRGTVMVRAIGGSGLVVTNRRLRPVPAEPGQPDRYPTTRGSYRYEPMRDAIGVEPALSVAAAKPTQENAGAWAWNARLDSRYTVEGPAVHVAEYHVETTGRQHVLFTLPAQASVRTVWVNESRLSSSAVEAGGSRLRVALPPGRSFARITIYFTTPSEALGILKRISPPVLALDIPVMAAQWTVWLPPGFESPELDPRWRNVSVPRLTWSQRLFGPLGRGFGTHTFNPLQSKSWLSLAQVVSEDALTLSAIEQVVSRAPDVQERAARWSDLVSAWQQASHDVGCTIFIDREALSRRGIEPQKTAPGAGRMRGSLPEVFNTAELVVLASADKIVVTTDAGAALYRSQLLPANEFVRRVLPGPLEEEIKLAALGKSSRLVSADAWQTAGRSSWPQPASDENRPLELTEGNGWSAYTLEASVPEEATLRVVRVSALRAIGWSLFVLCVALALTGSLTSPRGWILVGGCAAIAALVAPSALQLVVAPLVLGALCSLIVSITRRPVAAARPASPAAEHSSVRLQPQTVMVLISAFALSAAWVYAQEPEAFSEFPTPAVDDASAAPAQPAAATPETPGAPSSIEKKQPAKAARIHTVLVPVDEHRREQGGKYYVPEDFFAALYRRAAEAKQQPRGWLLTDAVYRAELSRETVKKELTVSPVRATFDFRVFQAQTSVRIPLRQKGISISEQGVKLDGRPIQAGWDEDGEGFSFQVQETGTHQLEVTFVPTIETYGGSAGIDVLIPKVLASRLELRLPAESPKIDVLSQRGRTTVARTSGLLTAELGGSERLAIRWPAANILEDALPVLDVEELIWAKVQPGAVVLDARFKFRAHEGRIPTLRLLADPRLQLLPPTQGPSHVERVQRIAGNPAEYLIELRPTETEQVVVELNFLLRDTSGIGKLRMPRLEAASARLAERYVAISVEPSLNYTEHAGDAMRPIAIPDFVAAWGTSEVKPQVTYSARRGEPTWTIATQPREAQSTVEQRTALGVHRGLAEVSFNATVMTVAGYNFQHRIAAPVDLKVDFVSVIEGGIERVERWSRDTTGLITVFLSGPLDGSQQIVVRGRLPAVEQGPWRAPLIEVQGGQLVAHQLQLFRHSPVLVTLEKSGGIREVEPAELDRNQPALGSFVGSYALPATTKSVALTVAPNIPHTRAVQVTTLERESDAWYAEVDYHVQVTDGLVDTLRFDIPPQWPGPYQIDRPANVEILEMPGEDRQQLLIRPKTPVRDQFRIRVRGRAAPSVGDRMRAPDIVPRGPTTVERYVELPLQIELQQVVWETVGLEAAKLPAPFKPRSTAPEAYAVYRVLGRNFQASLRSVDRSTGIPMVRLADISLGWETDGRYYGIAKLDIEPAGAKSCELRLPPGQELLHLAVGELPALSTRKAAGVWQVMFGSPHLPQTIEVVFAGSSRGASGRERQRFEAPRLANVEVERTLWTVYGPPSAGEGAAIEPPPQRSPASHELLRLESISSTMDLPTDIAAEQPPEDIVHWYRFWRHRFLSTRQAIDEHGDIQPLSPNIVSGLRTLDEEQLAIARRLGTESLATAGTDTSPWEGSARLLSSISGFSQPTLVAFHGAKPALELRYAASEMSTPSRPWMGAMLLGFATFIAAAIARRIQPRSVSPFAVMVVVSTFWWLYLAPSVLGLAVLLVTIVLVIRNRRAATAQMHHMRFA